jgi:membrane protein implicated in regulation of membrane protease activity
MSNKKSSFFHNNGLSIVVAILMLFSIAGQYITGWKVYNEERKERAQTEIAAGAYLTTGHFVSATFENWESEFLQMALYVLLTVWLFQKGSSESKDPESNDEEVDREPQPSPAAPWPVRKGGLALTLYKNSLTIVLALLFFLSFYLHLIGSRNNHNEEAAANGEALKSTWQHLQSSAFWFESFQNWQSEFLSVLSIVVLSIWFRQKGSPESKPVDAPYEETGE